MSGEPVKKGKIPGKRNTKKKNCYLQTWGQFKSLSDCPFEVLNLDLQGHAIYNVFAGENHSVYFTMKNELLGFGDDSYGQLSGEEVSQEEKTLGGRYAFIPRSLSINNKIEISKIICGAGFTFCIDNYQMIYSWGLNNKGQLGQGHQNNLFRPTLIRTLVSPDSKNQGSGTKTSTKGSFSTEPNESEGALGRLVAKYVLKKGEVVTDISCGGAHTLVLTSKSRVMSCGYGPSGALGHADYQVIETTFREVEGLTKNLKKKYPKETEGLELQIKSGVSHSCCLVFNRLYVWGSFGNVELGQYSKTPTEMNIKFEIADFECGDMVTVFLSTTGEVYTIGNWRFGTLGIRKDKIQKYFNSLQKERSGKTMQGSKSQPYFNRKRSLLSKNGKKSRSSIKKEIFTPIEVKLANKISQIAIGNRHIFALNQHAGKIFAWGDNSWGQTLPHSKKRLFWEPARVEFLNDCGSFVILCRGNNSFLISRKLIHGSNIKKHISLDDKLKESREKNLDLKERIKTLKQETNKFEKIKKQLREQLKTKNRQLEMVRMTTRREDFVEESAISMEPVENDYKWEINKIIRSFKRELSEDRTLKPHCEIDFKELELETQISEGGFGLIFKAKWRDSIVAVKVMKQELMKKELIKDFLSKPNQMSVLSWRASDIRTSSSSWGPVPDCLICQSCSNIAPIRVFGIYCTTKRPTCLGKKDDASRWVSPKE